ncbi:MAG: DUF1566 domain-containing protein [Candidatus Peribacteria bacterium]|nr:DUF1566 domain-containing protein [Candidatus Peribacteria bacterium]
MELATILDFNNDTTPYINKSLFDSIDGIYWSSNTSLANVNNAWYVNFNNASTVSEAKTTVRNYRCVR